MADDSAPTELSIREPPKVLIPVRVLEGQTLPESLVSFLAPSDVVVLGYHVLPEQTPTEQASMQFEERARSAVEDIARNFREAGGEAETRVVFTHDRDGSLERVADEVGATAILLPNPTGDVEDVLVAVRGAVDIDRVADLVATLCSERAYRVTVWGVGGAGDFDGDERRSSANQTQSGDAANAAERASETLLARGFPADRLATETTPSSSPVYDIASRSGEFDAIVMGEGGTSLFSALFGDDAERVAEGAVSPVLVVRERPTDG